MEKQKLAYVFALSAVLLWSTVATAFEISLKYFDFLELLLVSSFVSLIALLIIVIKQGSCVSRQAIMVVKDDILR